MVKKYLFLYLNTGGGHISSARVVKNAMESRYGSDVSIELYNGFHKNQFFAKLFFETGYHIASTLLPGAYSLTYDWTKSPAWLKFYRFFSSKWTAKYLKRYLLQNEVDSIVSFHFALSPAAVRAIRDLGKSISFVTVVTDPFTAHPVWFLETKQHFVVFSQQLKAEAVKMYAIPEENITVMPFLMNPKFLQQPSKHEIDDLKEKHGFLPDKKIVLLAGGGEGLPGALSIVTKCIFLKANFTLAVVCGRDIATKKILELLRQTNPRISMKIFGFVPFMDELVKICDCAVIKAGPATLLEVLKNSKPVIICKYIHGQELGNVRFAVNNHAGWFIQGPENIAKKINQLFSDSEYYKTITAQVKQLKIDTDDAPLSEYLFKLETLAKLG